MMIYCRKGLRGSDVYVYPSSDGLECCDCSLFSGAYSTCMRSEMIKHLEEHRRSGHCVPQDVFERLKREIDKDGDCTGVDLQHDDDEDSE